MYEPLFRHRPPRSSDALTSQIDQTTLSLRTCVHQRSSVFEVQRSARLRGVGIELSPKRPAHRYPSPRHLPLPALQPGPQVLARRPHQIDHSSIPTSTLSQTLDGRPPSPPAMPAQANPKNSGPPLPSLLPLPSLTIADHAAPVLPGLCGTCSGQADHARSQGALVRPVRRVRRRSVGRRPSTPFSTSSLSLPYHWQLTRLGWVGSESI